MLWGSQGQRAVLWGSLRLGVSSLLCRRRGGITAGCPVSSRGLGSWPGVTVGRGRPLPCPSPGRWPCGTHGNRLGGSCWLRCGHGLGGPWCHNPLPGCHEPRAPPAPALERQSHSARTSIRVGPAQPAAIGQGALCHGCLRLPEPWGAQSWLFRVAFRIGELVLQPGLSQRGAGCPPGRGEGRDPQFGTLAPWVGLCLPEAVVGCVTVPQMDSFPH